MNKKLGLKILFSSPLAVIKEGVRVEQQNYYRKKLIAAYGIDQLPTIDLLDLFPNLDESLESYSFLTGTSLITDLLLLKSLAKRYPSCAYLEIGSWRGESLVNVSAVTDDVTSISLSPEDMKALGYSEAQSRLDAIFSKDIKTIKRVRANSHNYDFNKLNRQFDLMFVDGDHSYAGVLNDTKKVFPIRKDGKSIIVWHDYGFSTESTRYSTLKGILDGIPKEKHKHLYHVSNTICAIYIEDAQFETSMLSYPNYPNKQFSLQVQAKPFKG